MALQRVVVTGMGALTPIGNTVAAYRTGLFSGLSGSGPITRFPAEKFKTRFACELKDFDIAQHLDKKEIKRHDRYSQYALVAAHEAVLQAGLQAETIDKDRVGVIWASGIGGLDVFTEEITSFREGDGTPRFNPFFIPKMIADIAAGHISMRYGFRGPNFAPVAACASSTISLIEAFHLIRLGKADVLVAGGSEAPISVAGVGGFNAMKALSERNDDSASASRPFDRDRDGFVMGEGAGALILESLDHALNRGAVILAEMTGGGLTADAYHLTAPHPDGQGAVRVMRQCIQEAGISPEQIDYINVHGTSTPLGDVAELKAIREVFGDHAFSMNISSTKSMTGHLLGAAGAIEAIACILAIQEQKVPPTINHFTDDPEIDSRFNLTFNSAQARSVRVALSNTFGFGGHNASVILQAYPNGN